MKDWNVARLLMMIFLLYAVVSVVVAAILMKEYGECTYTVIYFGYAMGLISTILTVLQWAPQIMKTYRMKVAIPRHSAKNHSFRRASPSPLSCFAFKFRVPS